WIAPLPIAFDAELPGYQNILKMMGDHGSPTLVMAQAIKDATMAYFILKNYKEGSLFLHYNGAYHSNDYEGILWYLKKDRPDLKYGTISTVTQDDVHKLEDENKGIADFIICVDSNMTTTY
ncbi:MAG: ChaN family lipoprotein, partial [Bacteroidota bacterium]|nr:ChaN family lipoprotein [Bacteroidota bacterium]